MSKAHASGTRKQAVARATLSQGKGVIKVNNVKLDTSHKGIYTTRIMEPLLLEPGITAKIDINITVNGGGISSQADAIRLAIAKAIVEYSKDEKIKKKYLAYDRHLLVADVRRKEPSKPNSMGKARSKRQKSYR